MRIPISVARLLAVAFVLLSTTPIFAQLVTFDTSGTSSAGSIAPSFNATQQAAGVAGIPQLSRTGLNATGGAAGSFFSTGSNTTNTLNLANQFVGYQVQLTSGNVLIATNINWTSQGSNTAPNSYATAYSTDGFTTSTQTLFTGTTSTAAQARNFDITDLITNDTLSVRLYNYGATGINGSASQAGGSFRTITPSVSGSTVNASTGNITLAAATEIRNSTALTLGGVISGTSPITKTGNGTLSLTGSTSAGIAVAVNAGSLTGNGTVGGPVTVAIGGTIEGGNAGVGTLNLNNSVSIANGGNLRAEIVSGTSDTLNLSGGTGTRSLTLATGSNLNLEATTPTLSTTYALANLGDADLNIGGTAYSTDAVIATFTANGTSTVNGVNVNISGFDFASGGNQLTLQRSGNNLILNFSPVPEPASMFALCGLVVGGFVAVRKLRRKGKPADVTPAA